jgi:peptide/nickel transport system permease protein
VTANQVVERVTPGTIGAWRGRLARDPRLAVAIALFTALVLTALLAPVIGRYDPIQVNPGDQLLPPSSAHWFGTDRLGFDVFSRVVHAAGLDLYIAISSVALSIGFGLPIGVLVGYRGGRLDGLIMRLLDVIQAFPVLVLAIGVLAALGRGTQNIILVVGLIGVPTYVRIVRAQVRSLRELAYIEAARGVGNHPLRLVTRYVVPGTLGTVAVQAATSCGWAIILTAGLGFLGLGVRIPDPEWGYMIATGVEDIVNGQWWMSFFPGLAIVITVFTFNLLGEVIADAVDPRRRELT